MDMPLPNLFYFTAIPMLLHQIFQINHLYVKTIVKTNKSIKSYHKIKDDGKENKQEMQENLAVEKKQHFEKVHSDLSSIEYGETSEHVENVQEALAFYDYYEGEIDGIYGTMTE